MAHYDLKTSQLRDYVGVLKAGDTVSLTGTVYTARDAAHKKILAALELSLIHISEPTRRS